jgi:hypothetical protein
MIFFGELSSRLNRLALHPQMEATGHLAVDVDALLRLPLAAVLANRALHAVLLDDAQRQELEILPIGRGREVQNHGGLIESLKEGRPRRTRPPLGGAGPAVGADQWRAPR